MIRKLANYRIDPESLKEVERAIEDFVSAIGKGEPETVYEAYRISDDVSFVHLMAFPDREAERAHQVAPYTKRFVDLLYPYCEEQPTFLDVTLVESSGGREPA
jgi:quinol monooxygenase YgiN